MDDVLGMAARHFFVLYHQISQIRERANWDLWTMVNYEYLKKESQDEIFKNIRETAFPEAKKEKPWWEDVQPGLNRIS